MTHLKVYEKYFEKLVIALPMDDVQFIARLTTNHLLPSNADDHIKSLPTKSDKAYHLLKNIVKSSLDIDQTAEFTNLIATMEKCGYAHIERLANEMKSDLQIELKGNFILTGYIAKCLRSA